MVEIQGKAGIVARVICDSISPQGVRLTTFEIEYPRLILSELNTHRMLSKNSASSRAIPWAKMKQQLTARPVRFGQANPGMQDKGEDFEATVLLELPVDFDNPADAALFTYEEISASPEEAWDEARHSAIRFAEAFQNAGYHKQIVGRLTEPFCMMKTVISGTEWNNFFWLRDDDAADPTIRELARCMREAREQSEPMLIYPGEYHLPYVIRARYGDDGNELCYFLDTCGDFSMENMLTIQTAIKVSCARTCAVSFRNVDYGIEKCLDVYDNKLLGQDKIHGSALEHAATPMEPYQYEFGLPNACTKKHVNNHEKGHTWQQGITHADRQGNLWSGNFKQWIQHRKTIPNENYEG